MEFGLNFEILVLGYKCGKFFDSQKSWKVILLICIVIYHPILMKGQLNANTPWLGMNLSMVIHFMSQRQDYVIVNFHLEFG